MERADFQQWNAKEVARLLALVENERRHYQHILASLPVGLVVLSTDRLVVSSNRAFRRIFDLRSADLNGKSIDQILPSERLVEGIRSSHMQGSAPSDLIVQAGPRSLRVTIVRLRTPDEEDESETLLVVEDLSRGPATAPVITEAGAELARHGQLDEQQIVAERHQALLTLVARLAHDLNNPLMIVTGYGEEILGALKPQDPMRKEVEQLLAAAERIAGITGKLLEFTRRLAKTPQPVDLAALVAGLKVDLAAAAGESVAVNIQPASGLVWAAADPEQLEDVMLALLSARREDAPQRSRVTIACAVETIAGHSARAALKPGVYARLAIHDNGRAPDAEKRAAVFESILDAKDPKQTAGVSPAQAYAIVRDWGGDIALLEEPSGGSTFAVYLPHRAPQPGTTVAPAKPAPPGGEPRETILVVEDEPGIRELLRKILRRERYTVLEAGSGEEALKLAAAHAEEIDLLLTDVMLPGMTGRTLAKRILEAAPDLKVLYVSGYTGDETVRTASFPPGAKFLQKPFTLGALLGKVREALDR